MPATTVQKNLKTCSTRIRAVTARLRVEQVFKFYWTVVAGLALVSLLLAWFGL